MKWMVAALMLATSSLAQAEITGYGLGKQPCTKFVEAANSARDGNKIRVYEFLHWVAGYATSVSHQEGRPALNGISLDDAQFLLEQYCRANQEAHFAEAVAHMFHEARPSAIIGPARSESD